MSATKRVAAIKNLTESQAREFCLQVQKCFRSGVPPFKMIAQAVQTFPNANPKEIALSIDSDLIYGLKAKHLVHNRALC